MSEIIIIKEHGIRRSRFTRKGGCHNFAIENQAAENHKWTFFSLGLWPCLPDNVIFIWDSISSEHVTRFSGDIKSFSARVSFDQRDHLRSSLFLFHQTTNLVKLRKGGFLTGLDKKKCFHWVGVKKRRRERERKRKRERERERERER